MNSYELMVIYNPTITEAEVKKHIEGVKVKIKDLGGKVKAEDFWGLKDLAYPMKKFTQAYYTVINFEQDGIKVVDLNAYLNRQEKEIIRSLISIVNEVE
jgi:small subunit ribosomal protein S6